MVTSKHCPNCEYVLKQNSHFCSNCGQDTHFIKLPFKHFFLEFLEGLFHFDTKIWLTLRLLFKSPGFVIKDFNANKRARYVPPIRLYIFVSVLFFILAAGGVKDQANNFDRVMQNDVLMGSFNVSIFSKTEVDSLTANKLSSIPFITEKQIDSVLKAENINTTTLNTKAIRQLIQIKRKETSTQEIGHSFITAISKILFVLMPLFAFFIWLIAGPRKLYYSETLVFSIYFHSFYFLLMTIALLVSKLINIPNLYFWVYAIACLYLITSVKIAFQKKWLKAIFSSLILIASYTLVFAFVFLLALVSSFIF